MNTRVALVLSLSDIYDLLEAARAQSNALYNRELDHACIVLRLEASPLEDKNELLVQHMSLLQETTRIMQDATNILNAKSVLQQ
jgi:hypothetical protein